jgi:hypothetical protein
MLERHWELADAKKKMAQTVIPHNKVKEVLAEMHRGTSGSYLELTKPSTKSGNVLLVAFKGQCREVVSTV